MKKGIILTLLVLVAVMTNAQNENTVVVDDRIANRVFLDGELHDSILTLQARNEYKRLNQDEKSMALDAFVKQFPGCQIVVQTESGNNELWHTKTGKAVMVDSWNRNNMQLADYAKKEDKMKKYGTWYYYVGGSFSGTSTGKGGRGISCDGKLTVGESGADDDNVYIYVTTSGSPVRV